MSAASATDAPHLPVLIDPLIAGVSPVAGIWVDGTFGAGGYARRLLLAGADQVLGIDQDPSAISAAAPMVSDFDGRLQIVQSRFSDMADIPQGPVDGVVLDLGVSSMQLDEAERGFSFMRDGPLDMRMSQNGPSAADLVNTATEGQLADILYHFGEERASRRIARAIVAGRPYHTTLALAETVAGCLPRPKPGQVHPATRSFQAIRIAVNDEFGELIKGLEAAEQVLKPGGKLAIVTFHSLEDRVVKRFIAARAGRKGGSRHAPEVAETPATLTPLSRKAIAPTDEEVAANPRARSAKLRIAVRTAAAAGSVDRTEMGLPGPEDWWRT
ncbi:16S rRNA (cytosine(1402)-N(4))-methyltransferase RsmH [Actibacterium sp. 188UL27-1]|uniref:16S rRNA (cytosine(1402)-N(4))-methyltransferase RsmH n=1 Tax=Actibacterium sp. 188UL27-1 TaxID=2786961 RepID=UPI0019583949|nr:16S rRNA (cytosine(1402)-N(4))-methyltransferase RsmH [Actibacterium sp. 188UL27-1]MBM7068451.1 16S rRNA (cytosine(1402)-N(4))-methyltransferase RsmH [Actibacterium sp. 188UL27-1]